MNKNLLAALICITLITVITLLSAVSIGFTKSEQTVASAPANLVIPVVEENGGYRGPAPGPVLHTVTFTNTFLPRQYVLPRAHACLYNSKNRQGVYLNTRWQISSLESKISDFGESEQVVQLGRETRTVELTVDQFVRWKRPAVPQAAMPPAKIPAVIDYPEGFDTIYLFLIDKDSPNFYPQCESLQPSDLAYAKKILLT